MDQIGKLVVIAIFSILFALFLLFALGMFEMPWFEDVYSRG